MKDKLAKYRVYIELIEFRDLRHGGIDHGFMIYDSDNYDMEYVTPHRISDNDMDFFRILADGYYSDSFSEKTNNLIRNLIRNPDAICVINDKTYAGEILGCIFTQEECK